jgi:hypothetical protein
VIEKKEICMNWNDFNPKLLRHECDANLKSTYGFFLHKICGINLNDIPTILFMEHKKFESTSKVKDKFEIKRVPIRKIVGTVMDEYSGDLLTAFLQLARGEAHIEINYKQPTKFMSRLHKSEQDNWILLSHNTDGTYYVDNGGNHRVIFCKILMLSEIAVKYKNIINHFWCSLDDVHRFSNKLTSDIIDFFSDITKKYWIYAKVWKYYTENLQI